MSNQDQILQSLRQIYAARSVTPTDIPDDIGMDFNTYELIIDIERAFNVAIHESQLSARLMRSLDELGSLILGLQRKGAVR